MKLKNLVVIALVLVGGYVAFHWLISHGGAAKVSGSLGGVSAFAGGGYGKG